jgi:hypothetical protein
MAATYRLVDEGSDPNFGLAQQQQEKFEMHPYFIPFNRDKLAL